MPPDLGVRKLCKPSIDIILLGHRERARGTRRDAVERQDKGRISLHSIRAPSVQASTTTKSSCPTQHCMALSPGSQGRFPHWETLRLTHSVCLVSSDTRDDMAQNKDTKARPILQKGGQKNPHISKACSVHSKGETRARRETVAYMGLKSVQRSISSGPFQAWMTSAPRCTPLDTSQSSTGS